MRTQTKAAIAAGKENFTAGRLVRAKLLLDQLRHELASLPADSGLHLFLTHDAVASAQTLLYAAISSFDQYKESKQLERAKAKEHSKLKCSPVSIQKPLDS